MKIVVTAIALCFVVSVGGCARPGVDASVVDMSVVDTGCVFRPVPPDDESAAHTEFIFTCHDGMKGRTRVHDDSVFSFGFAPVPAPFVGTSPRYRHRRVDVLTIPMRDTKCGLTVYRHGISSLVPPSSYDELWMYENLTFTTKGYKPFGLSFLGSYEADVTRGLGNDADPDGDMGGVFDSLIVMHLNHLHGEEVVIDWERDSSMFNFPRHHYYIAKHLPYDIPKYFPLVHDKTPIYERGYDNEKGYDDFPADKCSGILGDIIKDLVVESVPH